MNMAARIGISTLHILLLHTLLCDPSTKVWVSGAVVGKGLAQGPSRPRPGILHKQVCIAEVRRSTTNPLLLCASITRLHYHYPPCTSVYCCVGIAQPLWKDSGTCALPCAWNNGTGKLTPLISGDIWNLTSSTEEDCRAHCTSQTSFICAAVNYRQSDSVCELLTESNQTGTVETTLTEWKYSIRPLCAGIWFPWMAVKGQKIDQDYINQGNAANLSDCMTGCLHRVSPNTLCSSIVIRRSGGANRCELYSEAVGENGVTSVANEDWQFFNTPLWYRGSSPGVSNGDNLQNRNKVGGALRLFNGLTITTDGYLIGWQYYLTNAPNNLCDASYVSIWGVRGQENVYEHITSTLLRPENPRVHGVRFQFLQEELIPVKVNDVIGIYGCSGGPNHAVSVEIVQSGLENNAERRLGFSLDSFINPTFNEKAWKVSLRAYVAEYTRLPSPPSTSHASVNPGQIRLVIPALNNSDSLGAVYYRIMCSTDSSFSQSYNCHDELVQAGTTEVILDGLNITTPLYASVRVVRNFNEEEYGEDQKQTTSSFCPERNKLIESDVNVTITDHGNNTASVELKPTSHSPDSCVKFVSINYNGTEVFTGDSLQPSLFTVTQSPSYIYRFTMSLTLIDGHEMMYWEGEADLTPPPTTTTTRSPSQGTTLQNTGTSTKQNNVTKIVVPVVLVLLLLVLGGVLGVVFIRRRNSNRGSEKQSSPMLTVGDFTQNGEENGQTNISYQPDMTDLEASGSHYENTEKLKQKAEPKNDFKPETIAVKATTEQQSKQQSRTSTVSQQKPAIPSKPTAILAPIQAKEHVRPKSKVASSTRPQTDSSARRNTAPALTEDIEEEPYGNVNDRPLSAIPVTDLHKHIQQEKAAHPGESFLKEFKELSVFELAREVGGSADNKPKNRFRNIIPFDENRVKLSATDEGYTSDYVNASHIKNFDGVKKFVACQGPREDTIEDMWRLIHHTKCEIVVMTTMIVEEGKRKCEPYWPDSVGETKAFGKFSVTLREESVYPLYTIRVLIYTYANASRTVTQYHYTEWYDKNVPTAAGLLSFRSRVKQAQITTKAPIIVHCSAGVGRTGTYIALDILIGESKKCQSQNYVDIFSCVNLLRGQRTAMVQTHAQYAFLYEVLSEALTCGDTAINCSSFTTEIASLRQVTSDSGASKIQEQHGKMMKTAELRTHRVNSQALLEENKDKNRNSEILPMQSLSVRIWQPLPNRSDYINAVYCHSYQHKDGFIATQSPLPDTVQDFWTMIVEQTSSAIVYFNDCQSEKSFWPLTEGQSAEAGEVTVTNRQTHSDKIQEESGNTTMTTYKLNCVRKKSTKHEISLIELKLGDTDLPTSQQLVAICQAIERFTTTRNKPVTVVCKDGCRLSGLFIVAMNLFLRTRIEQQLDVVLEVKLAQNSRPQFVNNLSQFERLYEFVEYYLLEFSTYANY